MPRGPRNKDKSGSGEAGGEPTLPRMHQLQITDSQSRLLGLLWDRFIAELAGDLSNALEIAICIQSHVRTIDTVEGRDTLFAELQDAHDKFNALWEVHGCACGDPACGHNASNPDNTLGGWSGFDINTQ